MRIMLTGAEPPYPDVVMGGQLDYHGFASYLAEHGHCCLLAATHRQDRFWSRVERKLAVLVGDSSFSSRLQEVRSRLGRTYSGWEREEFSGYSIYRMHNREMMRLMHPLLEVECPDVVIAQGGRREQLALLASSHSIPSMIRLVCAQNVDDLTGLVSTIPDLARLVFSEEMPVISNSEFIAARVLSKLNVQSPVIYPPISLNLCVAAGRHHPNFITFVNPIAEKGVDLAIRIAELLPHRDFCFVQSWTLGKRALQALRTRLATVPNVYLKPATFDMRSIYESTALLLVPSQCEEAFGRVVLEACANGIPVVASAVGGIGEALGRGGLLLSATDPAERWAQAIESVLADSDQYQRLSSAGLLHAYQEKFGIENIVDAFLQQAKSLLDRQKIRSS